MSRHHFNNVKFLILLFFCYPEDPEVPAEYVEEQDKDSKLSLFCFSPSELFDNYMQQDAHEFLNYLLNTIADLLQEERKQEKTNGRLANGTLDSQNNNSNATPAPTWVHEIFQGTLTNETRCLTCETVRCLKVSSTVCHNSFVNMYFPLS